MLKIEILCYDITTLQPNVGKISFQVRKLKLRFVCLTFIGSLFYDNDPTCLIYDYINLKLALFSS